VLKAAGAVLATAAARVARGDTCGEVLDVGNFFEHNDLPYCARHYQALAGTTCYGCGEHIEDGADYATAVDKDWHPHHLVCHYCHDAPPDQDQARAERAPGSAVPAAPAFCGELLGGGGGDAVYRGGDGLPYCQRHWEAAFGARCAACDELVDTAGGEELLEALGKQWHKHHFACAECGTGLGAGQQFYPREGKPYCKRDYLRLFCAVCGGCGEVRLRCVALRCAELLRRVDRSIDRSIDRSAAARFLAFSLARLLACSFSRCLFAHSLPTFPPSHFPIFPPSQPSFHRSPSRRMRPTVSSACWAKSTTRGTSFAPRAGSPSRRARRSARRTGSRTASRTT